MEIKKDIRCCVNLKVLQAGKYGYPPYGHAEISALTTFCRRMDLDVNAALTDLHAHGLRVASNSQSIQQIAIANSIAPQKIYDIIKTGKVF
jgi:hypothetical protein